MNKITIDDRDKNHEQYWGPNIIIATSFKDKLVYKIPFDEILSIRRKTSSRYKKWYDLIVNTTEGELSFSVDDLTFIGDIQQWAKDCGVPLDIHPYMD